MPSRPATTDATVRLQIGRRVIRVSTIAEASARYADARDRSGLGASRFREGRIVTADGDDLRVSYNARIWRGDWPNAELAYDPAADPQRG